jgi:hypothetical protein
MDPVTEKKWLCLFIILGGIGTSLMVNVPAIFLGYGFAYLTMLLAAWLFKPRDAFLAVLGATILALPFLILPKSGFIEVALLNVLVRPIVTYPASIIRWRGGLLVSALSLTALEGVAALAIAILYYGDDGIHTGLAVFGLFLAPFAYAIYGSLERRSSEKIVGAFGGFIASMAFYFSLFTFPAVPTVLFSVIALLLLLYWLVRRERVTIPAIGIIIVVIGLALGGNAIQANLKTALYPFEPSSWTDLRWTQDNSSCIQTTNVFEYTHTPSRLRIVDTCVETVGVVKIPPFIAGDGDYCFDVVPENKNLLGIGNLILRKGGLHIEVVPADQERVLGEIGGVCPGDVVRVRGVWVIDTDHGMWTEIHPAEKIEVIKASNKRWPECVIGMELEE